MPNSQCVSPSHARRKHSYPEQTVDLENSIYSDQFFPGNTPFEDSCLKNDPSDR